MENKNLEEKVIKTITEEFQKYGLLLTDMPFRRICKPHGPLTREQYREAYEKILDQLELGLSEKNRDYPGNFVKLLRHIYGIAKKQEYLNAEVSNTYEQLEGRFPRKMNASEEACYGDFTSREAQDFYQPISYSD